MPDPVLVRVFEAIPTDIGLGLARLDTPTRQRLHVEAGDLVKILGKRSTAALVAPAVQQDEGKGGIRLEPVAVRNARVSLGDQIEIVRMAPPIAESIEIAPIYSGAPRMAFGPGFEAFVAKAISRRPFATGDAVVVPRVYLMGGSLLFLITSTTPRQIVVAGPTSRVILREETVHEDEMMCFRIS